MYVCILIQIALVVLAILSRIHFSKYKDKPKKACLSQFIYEWVARTKWVTHLQTEVQAIYVVSKQEAKEQVRNNVTHLIRLGIAVLFISTTCAQLFFFHEQQDRTTNSLVFVRSDYDGEVKTEDIRLSVDDKEYSFAMDIEPRQYSEEEFYARAGAQAENLKTEILGENPDFNHVSSPLTLPREDAAGIFLYSWVTDRPEVVTSYGQVYLEEITGTVPVTLTLTISYQSYEFKQEFQMAVINERRKDAVERVKKELQKLEKNTRTQECLTLPEQYENVTISVQRENKNQAMTCVIMGILFTGILIFSIEQKLREEKKKRDDALIRQYPSFVSELWLLLGTGMTVKNGICQILSEMKEEPVLKKELEYAMHQLDAGCEESFVYAQLGRRLKLPEYYQLMQHLSQHIRMGTKDLRNLMEMEMQIAIKKRQEFAKKKGEEASTKLLFPMIVLLAIVMILIIYPAMTGL